MKELAQRPKRQRVANRIEHQNVVAGWLQAVGVVPEAVGPIHLNIHESVRGFPDIDPADPADRKSVQAQAVSDFGTCGHLPRSGAHLEAQPWRGDLLEVVRICEEPKDLGGVADYALTALECVDSQSPIPWLVGVTICLRPRREEPR
jgi:hypothetical protein